MKRFLRLFIFSILIIYTHKASAQLVADFDFDSSGGATTHGCSPVVVSFHDLSTGSPTTRLWKITNSCDTSVITLTGESPIGVFTNGPCTYTVKLTVYNGADSSSITKINYVTVGVPPTIRFYASVAADTILACPGSAMMIGNTSLRGAAGPAWTWYIGGPIDSAGPYNTKNLSISFANPGSYDLTLIETDSMGCSNSLTKPAYIKIDSSPVACYTSAGIHTCDYTMDTVCFTNCSHGTSFIWSFGDGIIDTVVGTGSVCHAYSAAGVYTDRLIAVSSGGCKDTLRIPNDVAIRRFIPGYRKNVVSGCTFTSITFADTTAGATSWSWNFNDGSPGSTSINPSHIFTAAGSYTVVDSVWSALGCSGTASHTVVINSYPHITSLTGTPTYKCDAPDTVCFAATVSGGTMPFKYAWSFGDGSIDSTATPCHIYTSLGTFTPILLLTDTMRCFNSVSTTVTIATPSLSISATPDSGCTPLPVTLTTSITPASAYIIDSVHWGDGTPTQIVDTTVSTTTNTIPHMYTTSGHDTITLCYHLPSGCHYCVTTTVFPGSIHPDTPATITTVSNYHIKIDSTCPNDSVRFHANCPTCTSWEWYISDGSFSDSSFTHLFPNPGIYSIKLVDWKNGCNDTFKSYVYVFQPHDSFYVDLPACIDRKTYQFRDTSTGAVLYHWDFGDASPASTVADPTHTYAAYGTYTVTEYITGASLHSCTDTYKYVLHVYPLSASFSADDSTACIGQSILFTGPIIAGVGNYQSYTWYWGDGTFSTTTGNTTTHVYTADGIDTVRLVIQDVYGCSDTLVKPNYIRVAGASGDFTLTPAIGCVPDIVSFHDASTDLAGVSIISRIWTFGDGGINDANNINVTNTYSAGVWTVTLVDSDNIGCLSTYTQTVTATKPRADFHVADTLACPNLSLSFINATTFDSSVGDTAGTYIWHFGDGGTSALKNPTHAYIDTGMYNDTLIVISAHGCRDTMIKVNYIHVVDVNVAYTLSDTFATCPPLYVHMTNATTPLSSYTYQWKYGINPDSVVNSTLTSATYAYTYPGTYTITLIAQSTIGCKDSLKKTVQILGPTGTLTETPENGCAPLVTTFHLTSSTVDSNYIWSPQGFSSAGYSTDSIGFVFTYSVAGNYVPGVVVSANGCHVLIKSADTVKVHPVPVVTISDVPASGIICKGVSTTLKGHTTLPIAHYLWTPGGTSCDTCVNTTIAPAGSTVYTLIGTTAYGCADTGLFAVTVDTPAQIHIIGSDSLCLGQCDTVYATGVAHGTYTWTPDAGLLCTSCDMNIACPSHTTTYVVSTIDTNNCKDSTNFMLTVNVPGLFIPDVVVCDGYTKQITPLGAVSYVWTPATGLSCTTCDSPITSVTSDITYTVTSVDIHGCVDSAAVPVTVLDSSAVTIGDNITICHGNVAQLSVDGPPGSTYLWTPATGLSNPNISDPTLSADTTMAYTVAVTENECFTVTDTQMVIVEPIPDVMLPQNETVIAGTAVQVSAVVSNDTGLMYTWAPNDGTISCASCQTAIITPTVTTTTYTVTATSNAGCKNDASITITLRCDNSQVFVPNTFTPNGDGVNDRFYPSAKGVSVINKMAIYNRWGELVFSAENIPPNNPQYGWDGTFKNQVLQPDAFVYIIDATCEAGDRFSFKGDISLVR